MANKNSLLLTIFSGAFAFIFVFFLIIGLFFGNFALPSDQPVNYEENNSSFIVTEDAPPVLTNNFVTLSFIGDCIIGSESGEVSTGNFAWYAENRPHDYFFSGVYEELSSDTLTFANMECVLTDRDLEKKQKDEDSAYWFKAPAQNADILSYGSVEVAGIANNHIKDYGMDGYNDTKKALEAQNIVVGEDCKPLYFEEQGIRIGIVYAGLWSEAQLWEVENALEEMKEKCDYRIVFLHGGEEGIHEPDNYKIDCCRKLANEGLCELIVGSHPHVLQPMEVVNGVPIVYSLGNFCYGGANYPENRTIIFQVLLAKAEGELLVSARIVPCYVYTGDRNNWQPAIITHKQEKQEVLDFMLSPVNYRDEPSTTSTTPTETQEETAAPEEEYVEDITPSESESYSPEQEFIYE